MARFCRLLMIMTAAALLAKFSPPQSARAGNIELAELTLLLNPAFKVDFPPIEVSFLPNDPAIAASGTYTFATAATLNGSPFATAGSSVPASLYFSPTPGGLTGLVPGTAMVVSGTSIIDQQVDVDFNVVEQTPGGLVVLLTGELKGTLAVDTSNGTGTISYPTPVPWFSDLVYAGIPSLFGTGTPFSLSQVMTLQGGPLGITPQGNITAFSADLTAQFTATVPEPSSLVMAALGLGVIATAGLIRRRLAQP